MVPEGFNEALAFRQTGQVPLKSWERWFMSCFRLVNNKFYWHCSWSSLLGMNIGMMEKMGPRARFISIPLNAKSQRVFSMYFVALCYRLAGGSKDALDKKYGGHIRAALDLIPTSVFDLSPDSLRALLEKMGKRSFHPCPMLSTMTPLDFYVYLMHGYYCTTGNERALDKIYEHYAGNERTESFRKLSGDANVVQYLRNRV